MRHLHFHFIAASLSIGLGLVMMAVMVRLVSFPSADITTGMWVNAAWLCAAGGILLAHGINGVRHEIKHHA